MKPLDPRLVRRSHAAGGSYYLRKPFDPEVLIELVSKALWMPHLVQNRVAGVSEAFKTEMPWVKEETAPPVAVVPKSNLPKGKIPGLELFAVERVDQAVQLLRNL